MKVLNLTKSAQKQLILKNINIQVENKEPLCIMGESGCGKTTLLNIILGQTKPTYGKIEIDNIDISTQSLYDRNIKFIMQNVFLFEYMNIKENIEFGFRDDNKLCKEEKDEIIISLAQEFGISHILESDINSISEGQKQRVGLARAIVEPCKTLILDEAFNKIDSSRKLICMKILKNHIEKHNIQLIFTTHSLDEALFFNGYICIIDLTECVEFNKISEAIKSPNSKKFAQMLNLNEYNITNLRFYSSSITFNIDNVEFSFPKEIVSTKIKFNLENAKMFILQNDVEKIENNFNEKLLFKIVEQQILRSGIITKIQNKLAKNWEIDTTLINNSLSDEYFSVKINKILITES